MLSHWWVRGGHEGSITMPGVNFWLLVGTSATCAINCIRKIGNKSENLSNAPLIASASGFSEVRTLKGCIWQWSQQGWGWQPKRELILVFWIVQYFEWWTKGKDLIGTFRIGLVRTSSILNYTRWAFVLSTSETLLRGSPKKARTWNWGHIIFVLPQYLAQFILDLPCVATQCGQDIWQDNVLLRNTRFDDVAMCKACDPLLGVTRQWVMDSKFRSLFPERQNNKFRHLFRKSLNGHRKQLLRWSLN
jgi:hypothetical protein